MIFKVKDNKYPSRSFFANGQLIDFKNYEATVEASTAYRISRISKNNEYTIENKELVPFNPDSWRKDKRLVWSCNVASGSGFGSVTENVLLNLLKMGIRVQNPGSISGNVIHGGEYVDKEVEKSLYQEIIPDCFEVQYCQPPSLRFDIVKRIIGYHMFETTRTPKSWIKLMNKLERILVPSTWLIGSWRSQGLTVPISVFHHGINPKQYYYIDRPNNRQKYTFVQFGALDPRKGTDVLFKAFVDEFKNENKEDVQLILKTNHAGIQGVPLEDEQGRVTIIHSNLYNDEEAKEIISQSDKPVVYVRCSSFSKQQMQDLLFNADCAINVSRGEGFGLFGLEAAATGLPVIANSWGGIVDYSDPSDTLIIEHTMVHSDMFDDIYKDHWQDGEEKDSLWAEPSYEDLRVKMRFCYENRSKAKEMGKKASERIAKDWTWDKKMSSQLIPLLNSIV